MKVIKRDGRAVDYDRSKIEIAIEKANREVHGNIKATKEDIKKIIKYIENLDKKRMLVEDIQDIIEQKLMEMGKYELAKRYIVYRYTRALVRKANTTDESIFGLIRNELIENEKGEMVQSKITASVQRDYIAGEVSKDLTERMLLPEKIVKAHQEGAIYFHDAEFFVQPICNYSFINLEDMLENGTEINGLKIDQPKNFLEACIITSQIIANVARNQYGTQFVDFMCLGKYLKKSYEKTKKIIVTENKDNIDKNLIKQFIEYKIKQELEEGIKLIKYQINTLNAINTRTSAVTIVIYLEKDNPYFAENEKIIEEISKQIFDKCNDNKVKICKDKTNKSGTFNQGIVSLNLAQIAIIADEDEEKFWTILEERLELCYEALMCRHYALIGTTSDISPIHWQYGAIARLQKGEKIDKLLYGENSTISLGYIGIKEMSLLMKQKSNQEQEIKEFATKVLKYLQDTVNKWGKETNIKYILCDNPSESLKYKFAKIDKERFGKFEGITDKGYYSN